MIPTRAGTQISTHALREEGDPGSFPGLGRWWRFLPTPSARRATTLACRAIEGNPISTHALREEGDWMRCCPSCGRRKFLPTPSARRATGGCFRGRQCGGISTHALREEGDRFPSLALTSICRFLPTPSARRATTLQLPPHYAEADFYPRPPRGGRQPGLGFVRKARQISTHALREEGDQIDGHHTLAAARISTHALREEGD